MRRCERCLFVRQEGSFKSNSRICNPCVYRPEKTLVKSFRYKEERLERPQAAIRNVVKQVQKGAPFVYLVKAAKRFKIGYSTNVNARIRQLETGSSSTVELIAVAPGGRQLEQELHQKFQHKRIKGEWFDSIPSIVYEFSVIPGAMVFLPGFISQDPVPTV